MADPRILITGATGILGGALLAYLLRMHGDRPLLALVRAGSTEEGRARLHAAPVRHGAGELSLDAVEIIAGDLTVPGTLDDPRLGQVSHVAHLAANTSFRSVRNVRQTNILGTLGLAHRLMRAAPLRRFLHVGTAFACGSAGTPQRPVLEDDYPRGDANHVVEYTRAKAEAEMLLASTAPELPIVIARPSIVVGHATRGCAHSASIFWFYMAANRLRRAAGPLSGREDIAPVDYAAEALAFLLLATDLRHTRYHISAGTGASCSWKEIMDGFDRRLGSRPDDPVTPATVDTLLAERAQIEARLGGGDAERLLLSLSYYFRFPSLVFDNARLQAEGFRPPPRFMDYFDACLDSVLGRSVYDLMRDDD